MIGHLYVYPHPFELDCFIYVGQGPKRDGEHRNGTSSFGRRFYKRFPGIELPQPKRWTVEVQDKFELNELETIAMFQYHTWRGYEGGMNLSVPGSKDYQNMGRIGGRIAGRKNIESGHLARLRTPEHQARAGRIGGRIGGRKNVETGHLASIRGMGGQSAKERKAGIFGRTLEQHSRDSQKAGRAGGPRSAIVNMKNGTSIFAPGMRAKGGRKTKENGTGIFAMTSEQRQAVARKAGHMGGKIGGLIGGRIGMCKRWHRDRGIINPDCLECWNWIALLKAA